MEAVKVVDEQRRFAQPLAVELAPHGFSPAGVRYGEMQAVGINLMPIAGGDEMAQGVFEGMNGDLGIAAGAGGKEHQHGIVAAGGVRRTVKVAGEHLVFGVKGLPAFLFAVDHHLDHGLAILGDGPVGLRRHRAVRRAHHGGHARGLEAISNVLFQQLVGRQDHDGSQLVQSVDDEPELIMALEDQHHLVALFDADGLEIVGGASAFPLDLIEGEAALGLVLGDMQEGQLVGVLLGDGVHHVEGEIEGVVVLVFDALEGAVLVLRGDDEVFIHAAVGVGLALAAEGRGLAALMGDILRGVENHGVEFAVFPAHGNHAMGRAGIVIDGVAGPQDLAVGAHLNLEVPADDQVEFLALVGGQRDILALGGFVVFRQGVQRVGDAVFEGGSHVVIGHAVGLLNALAFPRPGQVKGAQGGAAALDQIGDVHAEGQGAAIEEGEVQVVLARLAGQVFGGGNAGLFRHLGRAEALHQAQLADTRRHFLDRQIQSGDFCHKGTPLLGRINKNRPKEIFL